jgi:hypothetical protein
MLLILLRLPIALRTVRPLQARPLASLPHWVWSLLPSLVVFPLGIKEKGLHSVCGNVNISIYIYIYICLYKPPTEEACRNLTTYRP